MHRCPIALVALAAAACAPEGKIAWSFETGPVSGLKAATAPRAPAQDAVVTIDPQGTASGGDAAALGAMGGPIDESDDPVVAAKDETLWLTLPEAPLVFMLQWPLPATGVTSAFGERADPIEGDARFHYGLDLEAQYGQVVRAAAAGRIATVGWNHGHGRQITITHAGAFQTGYSHLSQTLVYEGQIVEAGEALGLVGTSGRSTGPHLHFEVVRYGEHIDPVSVLGVPIKLR